MAADLHIHVLTPYFTEEDYKVFNSNSIGSKYEGYVDYEERSEQFEDLYMDCKSTPSVWVGEVSWLKAALFEDFDTYIPSAVSQIYDIIGEDFPIIDDEMIEKVKDALALLNNTVKEDGVHRGRGYALQEPESVIQFLERHKGEKAFTESW